VDIVSPFQDYYDQIAEGSCPDVRYVRKPEAHVVPTDLAHLAEHAFVQRLILEHSHAGNRLQTVQGVGVLGICGKIYPFYLEVSTETGTQYPWKTEWERPYDTLSFCKGIPQGNIFAGYTSGGWLNPILRQWQEAFSRPVILILPPDCPNLPVFPLVQEAHRLLVNPRLADICTPLSPASVVEELCKFFHGKR